MVGWLAGGFLALLGLAVIGLVRAGLKAGPATMPIRRTGAMLGWSA
jgi:hypothetical protein